ncbi:DEAD/DEAH box helicase [Roseococcus sp. SYP-B2431]|uniref:DEAD/DEAH box helicase n=1 Tax=Roseococcus sp. SYP-B2431 TaxID=2496640 RepID=UPI00103A9F6B|nr:DEAD/DEAH box helicase [Roseococcus sp. SYP-B2431]TCH97542.1 DEAD/DEAH box helicase [Roseococcus sp. SYP-B2431]
MPFPTLAAPIAAALAERGYAEPTAVQAAVLEAETAGRDLLVSAQTGSGKTVAYGLAISRDLLGEAERLPAAGLPLALVVAPTRELALQVQTELNWLYARAGGRVISCVGGMDPMTERRQLAHGAHIVVGTPGRLRDHIERGNLRPQSMRAVVLDEADEMLDLGFREDLEAILESLPPERRTLLFSATVPRPIAQLAKNFQRDALRIAAAGEGGQHTDIEYRALSVAPGEMERAVVNTLRYLDPRTAIVFCTTRAAVNRLHGNLVERGFSAVALSGELSQAERTRAMQGLRDGRARVCVATDVAARGLDLPDLALVIHADLPNDPETLLHRSGRTGRAGKKGISALVVPHNRRRIAERLLMGAKVKAEWSPAPSAEEIQAKDVERLAETATAMLDQMPEEADLALGRRLLEGRNPEAIAAALARLLRSHLPAPEELAGPVQYAPRTERGPRAVAPSRDYPQQAPVAVEGVWFRMNVGRSNQADPKWILPFLCHRGHVTREAIGQIRILDRETRFEVAPQLAERFAIAASRPGQDDAHIRIEPAASAGPADRAAHAAGPRAPHAGKPRPAYQARPRAEGAKKRPAASRPPRS